MARRPYGTGSLIEREGSGGVVTYYAAVRVDGQRHKIKIGRKRAPQNHSLIRLNPSGPR